MSLVWLASVAKNLFIPNDLKRILNIWNKLLIYYRSLTYVYQTIWNAYQNVWNAYNIHLKQTPYILQIVNLRLPNDLKCIPKHLKRIQYFPNIIVPKQQFLQIWDPDFLKSSESWNAYNIFPISLFPNNNFCRFETQIF